MVEPSAPRPAPLIPRYGARSLSDVLPSLLAALGVRDVSSVSSVSGVSGVAAPLPMPPARSACLLLLDGLGWELLAEHATEAPFLAELAEGAEPVDAGFPATTATSIASLATGRPPGEHGIVGYTFAAPTGDMLNALTWRSRTGADLTETVPPEELQPHPTLLQRAVTAGLKVRVVSSAAHRHSGLTRAALRGAEYCGVHALGDLAAEVLTAVQGRALCYGYCADLDVVGHVYGPGSMAWRLQLAHLDRLVASIVHRLPSGALLVVVADHGMVSVTDPVDADADPQLRSGVRLVAGDVRARHVYAEPGAAEDVLAVWREVLGERAWVRSRAEAVAAGWFGPSVLPAVAPRIGDVVVAARDRHGVVLSVAEPRETAMIGHHSSLTRAEQRVPFLLAYRG